MAKVKGQRPAFRVVAVTKERDERKYIELGAAWPSDAVPGSYNLRLADGVKVKSPEHSGTISGADFFFNIEPPRPPKGAAPADDADDDSDIPF